jgi:hypothetical protein
MATAAICVSCERSVYLETGETGTCPVCSSPVIATLIESATAPPEGYYLG